MITYRRLNEKGEKIRKEKFVQRALLGITNRVGTQLKIIIKRIVKTLIENRSILKFFDVYYRYFRVC